MTLALDLNPNNSANYENVNFHWGVDLDKVADGHSTPDNPAPSFAVDTTQQHVYQYVRGADPANPQQWDIYVDGELAIEDVSSLKRGMGLDGHEGFLWGSVTRGREAGTKSTSQWQLVQAQAAVCIYGQACFGAGSHADLDGDGDVDFADFLTLASDLALDISFGGDADQAANVVFQYTRAGDVTPVDGVVHVIPEPASMALLGLGGPLMLRRR